ncbi:hypothetical protein A3842_10335 [Paenibacillus sp. P3E]|uniref:ABC transporter substrate-binding protein n=1 Tax=Paenibacillus sp. P3E TaxID=1349435 RepID=UPI0009390AC7|nr:ABC transporter substrate-binding protein [Paenibacillus sp. P3E]OKP82411.1 hypothetical protein A3842_10335 [Paenibacillus sp. P3E]
MQRFKNIGIIFMLCLFIVLTGCGNASDRGNTTADASENEVSENTPAAATGSASTAADFRTLTDALGHEVKVPQAPQRIIAPFLEDPLTALDLKPAAQWGAGGEPQKYLQDQLGDVPVLSMDQGLQPEEVLRYSPDLIIFLSPAYLGNSTYEQFAAIAPTFILTNDDTDWRGTLQKLGDLTGRREAADVALKEYDEKLAAAKAELGAKTAEQTAVLLQPNDEKSFKLFGPGFYGGAMLYDSLGFKQPELLKGSYEQYSMETLPQLKDVDYIFVLTGKGRTKIPADHILWQGLPAVKEGRVFDADSGYWFNANVMANGLILEDVLRSVAAK